MPATAPVIVTRAQWGANPLVTPAGRINMPTPELWLHHTAGEQFDEAGMRMLQAFTLHRTDAHYVDLEYTFVVDHVDCRIFESRGPGHDSAATYDHNAVSHAICVMGNFETDAVSDQLVHTLANLVAWGYEQRWWEQCAITGGHRDASGNSTACPGDHLEAAIPKINALALQIHAGSVPSPTPDSATGVPVKNTDRPDAVLRPGGGRYSLGADGTVFVDGGAPDFGSLPTKNIHLDLTKVFATSLLPTSDGNGYWILTTDGAVFSFGNAIYHGGFQHDVSPNNYAVTLVPSTSTGYKAIRGDAKQMTPR